MMVFLIKAAQLILSLSILVVIHEFGHYITARMFKTRVEKFYLFFDFLFPFPHILNFPLFKIKRGDTEYGIGWFPLGGYVKIAGMIDESDDKEFLKSEPQPWEFRSKKPWQRLIIMLGGIIMNLLLAWVISSALLFKYGEETLPVENIKYGFVVDSLGQSIGLQTGDKIIGYNKTEKFESAQDINPINLLIENVQSLQIVRNGQPMDITVPESIYKTIMQGEGKYRVVDIAFPSDIDSIGEESVVKGKVLPKDRVIAINGQPVNYFFEISSYTRFHTGQKTTMQLLRNNTDTVNIDFTIPATGILGIHAVSADKYFEFKKTEYSLLSSIPGGVKYTVKKLKLYVKQFRIVFNPRLQGWKQMGGILSFGSAMPAKWDWFKFWSMTAFFSIALAVANLLPIPGLDGGHALFTIYEMITGKAPNDKFLERAQTVGMIIILALMVFTIGNDIYRFFIK
jgi:regulator of sigma E protease